MRLKLTLVIASGFAAAVIALVLLTIRDDSAGKSKLLATITAVSTQSIQQATITPDPMSRKQFHTVISDDAHLRELAELLRCAGTRGVGSHNGPIYECTLTIATSTGSQTFLASAHRYDPDDGYLSDTFWTQTGDRTYHRGRPTRLRVPALGRWLIAHEPNGRL